MERNGRTEMTDPKTDTPFDAEAFAKYMDDELPELLSGEGPAWPPGQDDGVHPDGSFFDWDEEMQITIETASDGRRYVIELREGQLVRVRELVALAA